jgi:hypothetical protein
VLSILELSLDINTNKMKYIMFMSCHHIMGQNRSIRITKESFESVAHFKFLMCYIMKLRADLNAWP